MSAIFFAIYSVFLYPYQSMINRDKIRKMRTKLALSQGDAAERAGWGKKGRSRWADIEAGRRPTITTESLSAIATALHCKTSDLLSD